MYRNLCLLVLGMLVQVAGAQPLSEVVGLALTGNASVKAAGENYEAATGRARSGFLKTLPGVNVSLSYRHVTDVAEINLPAAPPLPGRRIQLGVYDTYESGITLDYDVFTGFANEASIEIGEHRQSLSENELRRTRKDIAFQVIRLYRQVQSAELHLAALQSARSRVAVQKDRVITLLKNGRAIPLDTLALTLAVLRYDQSVMAAETSIKNIQDRLDRLAGQAIDVEPFEAYRFVESPVELNMNTIPDIRALRIQRDLIQSRRKLARSRYFPMVRLQASVNYGKPGLNMIRDEWMTYGIIGVGVNWNIWNWGSDKAALEAEEAAYRETGYRIQTVGDQVENRYSEAVRELETLKKQRLVAGMALKVAEERMKILANRAEQGMVSSSDFNEANLELTQTEIEYRQQNVLVELKRHEIEYICGRPINEWRLK